jgi:ABC-type phosphate transport system substrate-binding protein
MRFEKAVMIAIFSVFAAMVPAVANGQGFKIVANELNSLDTISKKQLEDIFMRRTSTWSDGLQALPVDQAASSSTRYGFSKVIFGRDVNAIKSYWQRQIFSGRGVPPPEKASDDEVLTFVRANPGAIGYVSSDADVGTGIKVLEIGKN